MISLEEYFFKNLKNFKDFFNAKEKITLLFDYFFNSFIYSIQVKVSIVQGRITNKKQRGNTLIC